MRRTRGKSWETPQTIGFRPTTSGSYRVRGPVRGTSRPSIYSDLYRTRRSRFPLVATVLVVAVIAVGLFIGFGPFSGATAPAESGDASTPTSEVPINGQSGSGGSGTTGTAGGLEPVVFGEGSVTGSGPGRLSFCAVGDNVVNEQLITSADSAAGELGDGEYDFTPLFAAVTPTIANDFDVAFINQETVLGGSDVFPYAGYPSFNSPDEVADALVDGGWDVINCNSNHTFDIGPDGIYHEIELWKSYPEIMTLGMFETEDEAQQMQVIERNGVRLAFLSYDYGINGFVSDKEGSFSHESTGATYDLDGTLVNLISETKLARDIPKAKEVADAVIVSMHFGEEYSHTPDEYQQQWAQRCADLGADVVLGTHTHFIQPVEWITGEAGNPTLVAWCLGDFTSGYGRVDASLGGMLSCDFLKGEDGGVTIENLVWTPTIEHLEDGAYTVHFLKDYTAEQASRNELYTLGASPNNTEEMVADVRVYAQKLSQSVMGDVVTIDGIVIGDDAAEGDDETAG